MRPIKKFVSMPLAEPFLLEFRSRRLELFGLLKINLSRPSQDSAKILELNPSGKENTQ
jgi:hypothetical protein